MNFCARLLVLVLIGIGSIGMVGCSESNEDAAQITGKPSGEGPMTQEEMYQRQQAQQKQMQNPGYGSTAPAAQ